MKTFVLIAIVVSAVLLATPAGAAKHPKMAALTTGSLSVELVDNPVGYYQRIAVTGSGISPNPNVNEAGGELGYAISVDSQFVSAGVPVDGTLGPVYFDFSGPRTTTAHLWAASVDGWIDTGISCPVVVP